MFRDYANMDIETLIPNILETMPIHQINFSSMQEFLGPDSIGKINTMKDIASALGRERCYFCSYHKSPFQFLQSVKLTGKKEDVGIVNKLPPASFYVPDFVYHPSCRIIQMQGIKTLCHNCFNFHSSMIKTVVMDEKNYTDSKPYRHILLPLARERNIETTELSDLLEEKVSQLIDLSKEELTWDLTYLYNRGLHDERSIYYKHEKDSELSIKANSLESKKDAIKAKAAEARNKNKSEHSKNNKVTDTEPGTEGWLEKHLSGQNPEYKVYAEVDSGAYEDGYDGNQNGISKKPSNNKLNDKGSAKEPASSADPDNDASGSESVEDEVTENATVGYEAVDSEPADNDSDHETIDGGEPVLTAEDLDSVLRQEAGESDHEAVQIPLSEGAKKGGPIRRSGKSATVSDKSSEKSNGSKEVVSIKDAANKYTRKNEKPDFRAVPGHDDGES